MLRRFSHYYCLFILFEPAKASVNDNEALIKSANCTFKTSPAYGKFWSRQGVRIGLDRNLLIILKPDTKMILQTVSILRRRYMGKKRIKSPATIVYALAITLALILTSACSSKAATQTTGTQQSKIFNLGALLPESGFGSSFGVPAMDGVRLAVEQINEAGGFTVDGQNYKIQLHEYDDGDATKEAAGATQLVQDGCSIILYEGSSDSAVQAVTEPAKCLLVIAGAPPTVTGTGIKYTFCIENSALGSSFWPAMLSGPGGNTLITGVKTVGILTEDYSTCVAARPGFIAACEAQGLKVVFDETVESDTTDYSAVVAKLKQADPDVLFFNSTASSTVLNLFPQNGGAELLPDYFWI